MTDFLAVEQDVAAHDVLHRRRGEAARHRDVQMAGEQETFSELLDVLFDHGIREHDVAVHGSPGSVLQEVFA